MILQRAIIQKLTTEYPYQLDVLRLDMLDHEISGNKWYKLKWNLEEAKSLGFIQILTFGGAYSNHIAACAAACKRYGYKAIGIIRGERPERLNETLAKAEANDMQLHFISREEYKSKTEQSFLDKLTNLFGEYYLIPEGGNNKQGMLGCEEILGDHKDYNYVFCACGTGTTYSGLLVSSNEKQKIVGISVLKGENKMANEVGEMLRQFYPEKHITISGNEALERQVLEENCIVNSYAFRGYASFDEEWYHFKSEFEKQNKILLDYVYTSKLMYAVFDLMKNRKLKTGSKILVIHSGGLQGNGGFESRYHLTPNL